MSQPLRETYAAALERAVASGHVNGIWLQSPNFARPLPGRGWKLHITATILNAAEILALCAPRLRQCGVPFKVPRGIDQLAMLNAGVGPAYSQIGKFLTVYPQTTGHAVDLAWELDEQTRGYEGPAVPFDHRLHAASVVYYRYGALTSDDAEPDDRLSLPPAGQHADPFDPGRAARGHDAPVSAPELLPGSCVVYSAIHQRGGGGVYRAIVEHKGEARACIVKEGRRLGEVDHTGGDGVSRLQREFRALSALDAAGLPVPACLGKHDVGGNLYLYLEDVGDPLSSLLDQESPRGTLLSRQDRSELARTVCTLVQRMHAAGFVWRDCKADNITVAKGADSKVYLIDFESVLLPHQVARLNPGQLQKSIMLDVEGAAIAAISILAGSGLYLREDALAKLATLDHLDAPLRQALENAMLPSAGRLELCVLESVLGAGSWTSGGAAEGRDPGLDLKATRG